LTTRHLRRAQLGRQPIAAGEQFVHFGDDAFLRGQGWEGDRLAPEVRLFWKSRTSTPPPPTAPSR
jgi:hypothetical protein